MKVCQWCFELFDSPVKYQVYCGADCRTEATKQKVKDRARLESIKRRYNKKRYCANGCGTRLNAYNDSKICNKCKVDDKKVNNALDIISRLFEFEEKDDT